MKTKAVPKKKPDYTPVAGPKTVLFKIEALVDMSTLEEVPEAVRRVLDSCCEYGYAEVVEQRFINEGFDEACKILKERAIK